jgi:hypothetical protein
MRLCMIKRVVAVVGETLRERREAGDDAGDDAIVPAVVGFVGNKMEKEDSLRAGSRGLLSVLVSIGCGRWKL